MRSKPIAALVAKGWRTYRMLAQSHQFGYRFHRGWLNIKNFI
jgi:hypothetical protein